MRRSTFLLASLMGLTVTACSTVLSVMPVGDEPVYLEPSKWEGLWVRNTGNGEPVTMRVVDAAGGILEYSDPKDSTKTVLAVVRQYKYADGEAKFISQLTEEDPWGYVWGKFQRIDNALIIWPPVPGEFEKLVETGEISGQRASYGALSILDPLSKDQLDRISVDKGHDLFNYEFKEADRESFPNTVWVRISTVLPNGATRCTSPPTQGEGASTSTATTGMRVLGFTITDLGERGEPISDACPVIGLMLISTYDARWVSDPDQLAINNAGQVVGLISTRTKDDKLLSKPFLWTRSRSTTELSTLEEHSMVPTAISNTGLVAGAREAHGGIPTMQAFLWDSSHGITDLGTLGGQGSCAYSLNDLGQVVGASNTSDDQCHAFLWEGGVMSDLGALGGDASSAQAINQSGQVVGSIFKVTDDVLGPQKAFLWTRSGGVTELGTLGGIGSAASAINEKGEVVGASKTAQGYVRAFIWHPGTGMVDLGTLGGRDSAASAVNAVGQVVGWSEITWGDTKEHHAVLWDHGRIIDLSSLPEVKAAGWSELTEAKGINDRGQIVGVGVREGKPHVFLLTPAPPLANGG